MFRNITVKTQPGFRYLIIMAERTHHKNNQAPRKQPHVPDLEEQIHTPNDRVESERARRAIEQPTPKHLTPATVLMLQRTHGNRMTTRLVNQARGSGQARSTPITVETQAEPQVQRKAG